MAPMAIGLIFFLLILLLLLGGGVFFYLKRRNTGKEKRFQTNDIIIYNHIANPPSKEKTRKADDPVIREASISSDANTSQIDLVEEPEPIPVTTITPPIELPKSSKNKRGGYSKQQFDELE